MGFSQSGEGFHRGSLRPLSSNQEPTRRGKDCSVGSLCEEIGQELISRHNRNVLTEDQIAQLALTFRFAPGAGGRDHRLFVMQNPPSGIKVCIVLSEGKGWGGRKKVSLPIEGKRKDILAESEEPDTQSFRGQAELCLL